MNASMQSAAFWFSMASIVLPLAAVWMALQFALLYRINRRRARPLANPGLAARAALGILAGGLIGLAFIAAVWAVIGQIGGPLESPGIVVMLLSLPAGAVLGFIAAYLFGCRWVSRAWVPGQARASA